MTSILEVPYQKDDNIGEILTYIIFFYTYIPGLLYIIGDMGGVKDLVSKVMLLTRQNMTTKAQNKRINQERKADSEISIIVE